MRHVFYSLILTLCLMAGQAWAFDFGMGCGRPGQDPQNTTIGLSSNTDTTTPGTINGSLHVNNGIIYSNVTTPDSTAVMHIGPSSTGRNRLVVEAHSSTGSPSPGIRFSSSRGSTNSPSASQSGDGLGVISVQGYGATGYSAAKTVISVGATQNWTDSAQGLFTRFLTIGDGTTTTVERLRINSTGNILIGTTTDNTTDILQAAGSGLFTGLKASTKISTTAPLATSMVTNGAMTTNITGWSGAGWAWNAANSGEALHTAGDTTALSSSDNVVSGQSYLVTYSVHAGLAGTVTMSVGGLTDSARSTSATFTYYGTATATTPIAFTPSNDFDGAVNLVSVQAMGPAITSCGTAPSLVRGSSSVGGEVVMGSGSPTACTLTYATAFTNSTAPTVTPTYNATAYLSAHSNSAFTVTFSAGNATSGFTYHNIGLNE